jgi:hypothetical protein
MQSFDMEICSLKKIKEMDSKEGYQVKIWNTVVTLENLTTRCKYQCNTGNCWSEYHNYSQRQLGFLWFHAELAMARRKMFKIIRQNEKIHLTTV